MVRVGEMTGRLEEVFLRLFDHLEFEKFMREQVKSALRYPTFVIATMAIAIVIVNIFVIPAFAKVFEGFNAELPLMTQVLIGFSNFMVATGRCCWLADRRPCSAFRRWIDTRTAAISWDQHQAAASRSPARSS